MVLALSVSACGLTMTRGPDPNRPPNQRPVCTESMSAPKRDAIPAILGFVTFLTGLLFYKVDEDKEDLGAGIMVGGAVVVVASYVSGGIGYFRVKRCRKAIQAYERGAGIRP